MAERPVSFRRNWQPVQVATLAKCVPGQPELIQRTPCKYFLVRPWLQPLRPEHIWMANKKLGDDNLSMLFFKGKNQTLSKF